MKMLLRRCFPPACGAAYLLLLVVQLHHAEALPKLPKNFVDTVPKNTPRRRGRRVIPFKPHPIAHSVHPSDLTLHLPKIEPDKINELKNIARHHQGTLSMAKKYGFNDQELKILRRQLKKQLHDYASNKKKQDRFLKVQGSLSRKQREQMEDDLRAKAKATHHELFKIKAKVIRAAKSSQVKGWETLKEMAQSADFSEQDRKDLLDEIKDHVAQTQRYYKMHLTYNQNLHNGLQQKKLTPEEFEEKIQQSKKKAYQEQQKAQKKERDLLLHMRSRLAGDL